VIRVRPHGVSTGGVQVRPSSRLNIRGMGETKLKVATADGVNEARNRRVEILLEPTNG
jgi:outer membrane protein OmpA-like peptidoglycan-associated protein